MNDHSSLSRRKVIIQRAALIIILLCMSCGLSISLLHIFHKREPSAVLNPVKNTPKLPTTAPEKNPAEAVSSAPYTLSIQRIGVKAPVLPVGLTEDNDMDINDDMHTTAWYKYGPKPGEIGSAVIAGHYGWRDGQGSIFNNLHSLKRGDELSVRDESDKVITFVVKELRRYAMDADASDVFTSTDNTAHLNLITCDGAWNASRQTYSDRLVVFTDRKDQ